MNRKLLVAAIIAALILALFALDLHHYFSLDWLKAQQLQLKEQIDSNPLNASLIYMLIYITVGGLSLPVAAVMSMAGGALFGFFWGLVIVAFASTLGAALGFMTSRYLLRDTLRRRFAGTLRRVDAGVARDGAFYLTSLRLVPLTPFFAVNLVMGLTDMRLRTFCWVSLLAMLPSTAVYVNAGTQLAQVDSLDSILSPGLLLSLVLLGLFPLLAKFGLDWVDWRRLYQGFPQPEHFDYNLLVIGAGAGGLVSAYIAAAVKARVGLIERERMGGDCLYTGCVPSKALLRSASLAQQMREADHYGLKAQEPAIDFARVMQRVQRVVSEVAPHDSAERYNALGVDCLTGNARLISPWELELTAPDAQPRRLSARAMVIATGGKPWLPDLPGLADMEPLTSDTVWQLRQQPQRLLVLGGGPVGCELSQAFARLGCPVTQVEMAERVLLREDPDVSQFIQQRFTAEGIDLRLNHKAERFALEDGEKVLYAHHAGSTVRIPFDQILVAVGRTGNTEGLGLENLGIQPNPNGTLPVADDLSLRYPNLFACGDVAGHYQFTHTAAHQAWYAAVNGLFGRFKRFRADYSVIPWVTFTAPEVGRVGLNETEAQDQRVAFEVTRYRLDDLDRAITEGDTQGFIKVLTAPGKDRILGATVVGAHAGEILAEFVLAMKGGIGLKKILATIHAYPTWNEAVKYTAGAWRQAHAPQWILSLLGHFHRFQRKQ